MTAAEEAEGRIWRPLWASGSPAGSWPAGGPAWEADWFVQPGACDPHPQPVLSVPGVPAMRPEPDSARGTCREARRHTGHRPAHAWKLSSPLSGVSGNYRAWSRGTGTVDQSLPNSQPHSCLLSTCYVRNPHHTPAQPTGTSTLCPWDLHMTRLSDEEVKLPTVPRDETRREGAEMHTEDPKFGLPSLWLH